MENRPAIGFIGLGLMGSGMAANLLKSGHELLIMGRSNREPIDRLVALGAKEAASAKVMAETCSVIHLCLPNSAQVEQTLRGPDGILAGARTGLIVIDTSTSDPASTLALASELAARGGHFLDAPLGGTPVQAEAGQLTALVGGDEDVLERVRTIIGAWASTINRIGPVGCGHKMKLLMNFIGMAYGALYSEAVVLAVKIGITPAKLREVIEPSRMGSGFFNTFMAYVVDRNRDAHKFSIENAAKDLRYVNQMAADARAMNLISAAALQYYTHVEANGHAHEYVPMLSDHVGRLSGIDMSTVTCDGTAP